MKKFELILLFIAFGTVVLWADDNTPPAYQIADNSFFDPTKKIERERSYQFGVEYRIEAGYVQHEQRARNLSYPGMYLHGARIGASFNFLLPIHFSLQTGLYYTLLYGRNEQHWRSLDAPSLQTEYINHRVLSHNLTIPIRVYYTVPLWKRLNLFFYTGPQLHIGLAQKDYMEKHLSEKAEAWLQTIGVTTEPYDRLTEELYRANIQWGLGGGLEWDCYRLESGYDFGLNNLVRNKITANQYMSEWGWYVSFGYRF